MPTPCIVKPTGQPGSYRCTQCNRVYRNVKLPLRAMCKAGGGERKQPEPGVGTELKRLLRLAGIRACKACAAFAKRMNEWGTAGCRERLTEIVDRLLEEAQRRSWGFFTKNPLARWAATKLVLKAIRNEEKRIGKQASQG